MIAICQVYQFSSSRSGSSRVEGFVNTFVLCLITKALTCVVSG